MKEITKAQEEILKALWHVKEGAISDIRDQLKEPKPAYNTVATVVKVLEKKGFVDHKTFGNMHVYFPVISKIAYGKYKLNETFKGLFNSSPSQIMSAFIANESLSIDDLEELKKMVDRKISKAKKEDQ